MQSKASEAELPSNPRRLSILILGRLYWPGGVARILLAEGEQLQQRGHRVHVVFIRRAKNAIDYRTAASYRVVNCNSIDRRMLSHPLRLLTISYAPERGPDATVDLDLIFKFELGRTRYDVVIYGDTHTAVYAPIFSFLRGEPYIVHVHETALKTSSITWKLEERFVLGRASSVITNSMSQKVALSEAGVRRVRSIFPGTTPVSDPPSFDSRSDTAISVTLWDFGRHPEKLAEVARNLSRGAIVLAGAWTETSYLSSFRERYRNEIESGRLVVTGPLSEEALLHLYGTSKVGIRLGYQEFGPGMGSLEMIGNGLPLVYNRGIGISSYVIDGENGIKVDADNPTYIASRIEELWEDQERWGRMHANNLKLASRLSWSNHAAALEDELQAAARWA